MVGSPSPQPASVWTSATCQRSLHTDATLDRSLLSQLLLLTLLSFLPSALLLSPFSRFCSVRHKRWCLQWLFNRGWKMLPLRHPAPQTNGKHLVWSECSASRVHTCTWKHVFTLLNLAKNSQWLCPFCNHIESINYAQASQTLPVIAYLRPPMSVCVCVL